MTWTISRLAVLVATLGAAVLSIPTAQADSTDIYLSTLLDHGVRTLTYQDRTRAVVIGLEVCQHLRVGSNSMAEAATLQRRGAAGDRGEWIVRAAQAYLCPDTIQSVLGP